MIQAVKQKKKPSIEITVLVRDQLIKPEQAAFLLGVTRDYLMKDHRAWFAARGLKYVRYSERVIRFRLANVMEVIERISQQPNSGGEKCSL